MSRTLEIVLLLLLLGAGLMLLPAQRKKEKAKKRQEALIRTFPGMLVKLELLIRSGLSVRLAWKRLAEDYLEKKKENPGLRTETYEEMVITLRELDNGVPEAQAYVNFGRRTGVESYIKLGNLLAENLRQGISGFSERLQAEITDALERRKNEALKKGEEAGTRLVFPMTVMLVIVMAVIMIPAFMRI